MKEITTISSPFRTILFAGDFGKSARRAFTLACSLAKSTGSRLIILHVEEPLPFGEMDVPVYVPGEPLSDSTLLLSQLQATYEPDEPISVEYRLEQGQAVDLILRTAEEAGCDLIVMGTHGRTGIDRLLVGSVAEGVMRGAHCACLTVAPCAGAEYGLGPIRTILHPTDFSDHSAAALRVARSLARDHGARLVLLHVVAPEAIPAAVPEVFVTMECDHESLQAIRGSVEGPDLKGSVEARLRRGDPAATVIESAADLGCDLIVIGSHGRTALGRLLMGSVAEAVMRGASCPVLIVKLPSAVTGRTVPLVVSATPS